MKKAIATIVFVLIGIVISNIAFAVEKKSSDATLSNLGIIPNDFTTFVPKVLEYDLEVENECTEVEVYAETTNSRSKVEGTGNVDLKVGMNILPVTVTAEDGTTKTYTMNIHRESGKVGDKKEISTPITSIIIEDTELKPEFNPEVFVYDATYIGTKTELKVDTTSNNEDYVLNIVGNKNLEDGKNTITILCTNVKDRTTVIYQVNLNKNQNQKVEETQSEKNEDNTILYIIFGIAIVIIVVISIILIKESIMKKR